MRIIQIVIFFITLLLISCGSAKPLGESGNIESDTIKKESSIEEDILDFIYNNKAAAFIEALTSGKADLNWSDSDGATYLHHAVWEGRTEIVKALIAAGADINSKRKDGYTPLHWAAYKNLREISIMLLEAGANTKAEAFGVTPLQWAAQKNSDISALALMEYGADIYTSSKIIPSAMEIYKNRFGDDIESFFHDFGFSVLAALFENPEATQSGRPALPPYPKVEMSFENISSYLDTVTLAVSVYNSGKGDLYKVYSDVTLNKKHFKLYFGMIRPGESATRTLRYTDLDISDCGRDLPVSISFSEENEYTPPSLEGKIHIPVPDGNLLIDRLPEININDVRTCLKRKWFSDNEFRRAVIMRSTDIKSYRLHAFVSSDLIDRTVIDKLIRQKKINYTIDDLIFFAEQRAISQENLELVLLEKRIEYSAADVLAIAKVKYISRQVVEALYSEGLQFSKSQIQELIALNAFSLPEVLYTYSITDDNSGNSVGNGDGIIQRKEGVDFEFIIKNNSIFTLNGVNISLSSNESSIDLFNNNTDLSKIDGGETVSVSSTIAVKPAFTNKSFNLVISIEDQSFGSLLDKTIEIPVGKVTGSKILTINKKIATSENVIITSGASDESPQLAAFSEGAVLDAVGELGKYYKVAVYGKFGWIKKTQAIDFVEKTDSMFLVENRSDFALEEDSENYTERLFVNSRPQLVILSPSNNADVYNRTDVEILAIDQSYGINYVDIRVNGESVSGSSKRGLKVVEKENREIRKTYSLALKKGKNIVRVTVYNSRNVASDAKEIVLYSQGVQNPPSLYVLSIGVSKYQKNGQNLAYAASDASTVANVFNKQKKSDIYDKVHIKTLLDDKATRSNIIDGINNFLSDARSNDVVVLFFAGHGITDSKGRYFLLGYDADMNNPSANGISHSAFEDDLIAAVQARKVIIMLDSCQSGGVTGRRGNSDISEIVEGLSESTGFAIISAARGNEYAYEDPSWGGGAFTMAIEAALDKNKADANKDGFVDINELDNYIYEKVIDLTKSKQHPTSKRFSAESYKFFQVQ